MSAHAELRRELRARRMALTHAERHALAANIARHLLDSRPFNTSRRLAVYLPNNGEVDPQPIIECARARGKEIFLPVLDPVRNHQLRFAAYRHDTKLHKNRYGIPEPIPRKADIIAPTQLDLVLTPLVGFDAQGNRLGMGGGYYDRSFAFLSRRRRWHKPLLIGLAYAFQECEQLKQQPWDVPLDGIITEQGLRLFR